MKILALALAAVLFSALPALAQADGEQMKAELERVKAESAARAAQVQNLQAELEAARSKAKAYTLTAPATLPTPVVTAPSVMPHASTPDLLSSSPFRTPVILQGKVTAVALEIGLVVLSIGSEDGVREKDEFTLSRAGEFVAKVAVDRVDRKWSAGKVLLQKQAPLVNDNASNGLFVAPPAAAPSPFEEKAGSAAEPHYRLAERYLFKEDRASALMECQKAIEIDPNHAAARKLLAELRASAPAPLTRASADEVRSLRKELDEVRGQVRQLSDRLLPSFQGAGLSVEEMPEELRAHLGTRRGLLVRQVREGSPAEKAGLKAYDVIPGLVEAQLVQAVEGAKPIQVIRQGQQVLLPGPKGR